MKPLSHIIGGALVGLALAACSTGTAAEVTPSSAVEAQAELAQVVADAKVVPARTSDLSFQLTGTVAEIAVAEGEQVEPATPLARLDTRDLELDIAAAEASLREARANYDQIAAGATEEEIAAASALVEQASAQARQVEGTVTNADIQAAREQVAQAQADLAALGTEDNSPQLRTARAQLAEAEAALQSQRDTLSRAKTRAEAEITTAAEQMVQAQAAYAEAVSNWTYVQDTGNNPAQPTTVDRQGKAVDNEVESAQREQYYATFVQAEAALRQAEQSVAQAQVDADEARKAELVGIQRAEAQVATAQAAVDELLSGGAAADRAAARARLAEAQANLAKLTGDQRAAEIAGAQASLQNAQANLASLTAPAREVDLAKAQASIESAEVRLQQAQLNLDKATLRAPFAGTVAEVNLDLGEEVSQAAAMSAVVLGDFSTWKIETDDLTERDVVRFSEGASAQIRFDALPDVKLDGTVTSIQPIGKDRFGDMTYVVTVTPTTQEARLRWNMSATVTIDVGE